MKFKNNIDSTYFKLLNLDEKIIRNKLLLITKNIKDRRKSMNMKIFWKRNALKMKKALRKWHNSTQGKRFHKNLGFFLATHLTKSDLNIKKEELVIESKDLYLSTEEVTNIMLGLNNIKTHLIIELQYFEKDLEALEELLEMFFMFLDTAYSIEPELLKAYITGKVPKEIVSLIINIFLVFIDDKQLLYSYRENRNLINDKNINEEVKEDINNLKSKIENIQYIINKYG